MLCRHHIADFFKVLSCPFNRFECVHNAHILYFQWFLVCDALPSKWNSALHSTFHERPCAHRAHDGGVRWLCTPTNPSSQEVKLISAHSIRHERIHTHSFARIYRLHCPPFDSFSLALSYSHLPNICLWLECTCWTCSFLLFNGRTMAPRASPTEWIFIN